MAVRIRLKRLGKNPKKRPFFRVAVFDERRARDGRFIEELGYYDPTRKKSAIKIKRERYDFWIKNGALATDTVKNLIRGSLKTEG